MQMDLIICLEMDGVYVDIIQWLKNDYKITNIIIDEENIIRANIVINNVEDLQQLGFLLDDDIVLAGADMNIVTHKYALKELGW